MQLEGIAMGVARHHQQGEEPSGVEPIVMWVGLLASVLPCGVLLTSGIMQGWSPGHIVGYLGLVLLYVALKLSIDLPSRLSRWLWRRLWLFLLLMGGLCLGIQALMHESFLQPIIFTVPMIYPALVYPAWRVAIIGAFYLGVMNVGIWLSGPHEPEALIFPTIGYSVLMVFMYAFTRLSVEQGRARRRADRLSDDLARQRDDLARLASISASLTRDLDLAMVLEQVVAEGRALARAGEARVWLFDEAAGLRFAAPAHQPDPPPQPPADTAALLTPMLIRLPLVAKGTHIGALELIAAPGAPFREGAAQLMQPFASTAATAIENARLYEQARLSAALAERNRLARELHDTIAQGLTAVTMQIEAAQRGFDRDPARARARLARAHELARATLDDVRRSVWTLAEPLVDGEALGAALHEAAERFVARTGLRAGYRHEGAPISLGSAAAGQALRIVQEALQNVEKHAGASRVEVGSASCDSELRVWVADDGRGFDPERPPPDGAGAGFGLRSLRERARLAGGALHVESAPGQGTRVTLTIPIGEGS